jgi:hypothetical protein
MIATAACASAGAAPENRPPAGELITFDSMPRCDFTVLSTISVSGSDWGDQLNGRARGLGADGLIDLFVEYAPGDARRRVVGATATAIRFTDPECKR